MPVPEVNCACGQPLHYANPKTQAMTEALIAQLGEYIKISRFDGRAWMVQRHYIALHGISAKDLGTDRIPKFEEVAP